MPRSHDHQTDEVFYHLVVGNIPPRILRLPQGHNWRPIKDEIRTVDVFYLIKDEAERTGKKFSEVKKGMGYNKLVGPDLIPRCQVRNNLGWFQFRDYDEAVRICDITNGHVWERCVLEAWLLREQAGISEQLRGPVDNATGLIRPVPVPLSPVLSPMAQASGSQRKRGDPLRPHQLSPDRAYPTKLDSVTSRRNVAKSSAAATSMNTGSSHLSGHGPTSSPVGHVAPAYRSGQEHGQTSPTIPLFPRLSSSSGNSSSSTLLTMMMLPDASTHSTNLAFRAATDAPGVPFVPRNLSISNIPTTDNSSRDSIQVLTPPASVSGSMPQNPTPNSSPASSYKVTVTNLSPQATWEQVGDLVEQKTRRYVTLSQPDPIKLRKFRGQLHAYVRFTQKVDAEKAVQQIRGLKFMGRQLHAVLEDLNGH